VTIEVPLGRGRVALIDEADADLVFRAGKWCAFVRPQVTYAQRSVSLGGGRSTVMRMHNLITGARYVDHINGDGLDNRRANLRPATHAQNMRNTRLTSSNTSGFRGVYYRKDRGAWAAQIVVDGRRIYLGRFSDAVEAARAYDEAARLHHGEFATLNFPAVQS
jgi:hypothetical protein